MHSRFANLASTNNIIIDNTLNKILIFDSMNNYNSYHSRFWELRIRG